jgi:DNA segregation ATPase FtsK/SpoIIIE, S-DNA-T family
MPVALQVRQVRDAIYEAAGRPAGEGEPSTALLGRLFHEVFAELVGAGSPANFVAALADVDPTPEAWRAALLDHAYRRLVGPRLAGHHAVLQPVADRVLTFWQAVREMCGWLVELLWAAREAGSEDIDLRAMLRSEQPLRWEVRGPGWADAVVLTGVADLVWRLPEGRPWCLVELKLGRTAPEADLAQACLYHQMLSCGPNGKAAAGALSLVSFEPQRRERLFQGPEVETAQQKLKDLIGRLAGVLPSPAGGGDQQPKLQTEGATDTHREIGKKLVTALKEYGASVHVDGDPVVGPTFLRFRLILGRGVKYAGVARLAPELRLRLGLEAEPRVGVERDRIVVDLQRPDRKFIRFGQVRDQLPAPGPRAGCSLVPLGVDLSGRLKFADLSAPEHCHFLVAGTAGSGKSEWLRAALAGLIATNTPETLRLLLIDPKRNAFLWLRNSPYLLAPLVFPDERPVAEVLQELIDEMERRYQLFERAAADNLAEYNRRAEAPLPRVVCACDEYADLLTQDRRQRRELEEQIARLGAKARAAGIHLLLATQRPSREVVRGALDTNMPARVGLQTAKAIESRMLLGEAGAERLLGRGDLLFKAIGEPERLQSVYLAEEERDQLLRAAESRPAARA